MSSRVLRPGKKKACASSGASSGAQAMRWPRHKDLIGGERKRLCVSGGRLAPPCYCWMPCCRRTGAHVGTIRAALPSSWLRSPVQPVSTKALGEGHTRRTMRIGAPQVGQRVASAGRGLRCGGWLSLRCPCTISRRMVVGGMVQLAWRKPKWRTFMKPCGKTCWRNRRINAMTSRCVVRSRALPTFR